MTRRHKQSGFTLMEVVVATTLMAMLMSILFTGLRLGANAWHRGQQKLDEKARAVAGIDLLERQVAAAMPRLVTETREQSQIRYAPFRGSSTQARFLTATSWQSDHSRPLFVADYRVLRTEGGQQLVIRERPATDADSVVRALAPVPMLARLETEGRDLEIGAAAAKIEFWFLQPATPQTPAQWVSEWTSEQHLEMPHALRIVWTRGKDVESATMLISMPRDPKLVMP